ARAVHADRSGNAPRPPSTLGARPGRRDVRRPPDRGHVCVEGLAAMYTEFYGLTALPFELSPNPKYLLLTPRHREALANLQYGISARKSLTLLLREAGTGETTAVH